MNRMTRKFFFTLFCCTLFSAEICAQNAEPELSINVFPETPLIERRDHQQLLNFDLAIANRGKSTLRLTEIEVSVLDEGDHLVLRKTVNSDGFAPGIEIAAPALLAPGQTIDVFNPFYSFAEEIPLHHLRYVFRYLREDNPQERTRNAHRLPMDYDIEAGLTVPPRAYRGKTTLILPLAGRVFVWEGHDFYAHHRRVPLHAAKVQKAGVQANANRYGADLAIVNEQGLMYHDSPFDKKNWYSYGALIYAPAAGVVVASANDVPDNEYRGKTITTPPLPSGADPDLGNYVLLDHGNREFSLFPHMMPGSVRLKAGQSVRQGEAIGQVGFSGDAIFPHVHYSLLAGPDVHRFESLPAYFGQFRRLLGAKQVDVQQGTIDSGDFVESTAKYQSAR